MSSSCSKYRSAAEKAFSYLQRAPRITEMNIKDNPGARTKGRQVRAKDNKAGQSHKELQLAAKPPLGWIWGDWFMPWQRRFPSEKFYNKDIQVNIEVQWASELAIAAIERNGGCITVGYYDPVSLLAAVDPIGFFQKGEPIPKRAFPPMDIMDYYTDPYSRGYLANPHKLEAARQELAQKYGYQHNADEGGHQQALLQMRKDPLQIFYGLEPGWIVSLKDKTVFKPLDPLLRQYYNAGWNSDSSDVDKMIL